MQNNIRSVELQYQLYVLLQLVQVLWFLLQEFVYQLNKYYDNFQLLSLCFSFQISCFKRCIEKVQNQADALVIKQIQKEENRTADETKQQAQDYLKKQNFDEAAVDFIEAAQKYRRIENDIKNAGQCYQLAAEVQEKMNEQLMAAVYYRDSITQYFAYNKQQIEKGKQDNLISVQDQILPLIQKSGNYFEQNGKLKDAAKMYILESQLTENKRQSKQLKKKGIDLLLSDNKPITAANILCDLIDFLLDNQMYSESIEYIDMAINIYQKQQGYKFKINEMLYYKVLMALSIEDYVLADSTLKNQTFQDCPFKDSMKYKKEILQWIYDKCKYSVSNSFIRVYNQLLK